MRDIWKCTSCFSASAKASTFLLSLRPSFRQAPFPLLFLFPFLFPFPWNDFFNQQDRGSLTSFACTEHWQTPSPVSDWFGGRKARKRQEGNQNWILKGKVLNVWGNFSLADWGQSSQMDIRQTNPRKNKKASWIERTPINTYILGAGNCFLVLTIVSSFLYSKGSNQMTFFTPDPPLCPFCTLQSCRWYPRVKVLGCRQGRWPSAGPCCPSRSWTSLSWSRSWCWTLWWCIERSSFLRRVSRPPEGRLISQQWMNLRK